MDGKKYENYKNQLVERLMEFLKRLNSLEEKYNAMEQEFNNFYDGDQIPEELVDKGRKISIYFFANKRWLENQ